MPRLTKITYCNGIPLFFKLPYYTKVISTFERVNKPIIRIKYFPQIKTNYHIKVCNVAIEFH